MDLPETWFLAIIYAPLPLIFSGLLIATLVLIYFKIREKKYNYILSAYVGIAFACLCKFF
jgi:hypothetical protein